VGVVLSRLLLISIVVIAVVGVVFAAVNFGRIEVSYEVTPAVEAPTLSPNPIILDLGSIPSGSTGSKDFGVVGSLSLPAGYEITFSLDTSCAEDFESLAVYIYLYEDGSYVDYAYLTLSFPDDSLTLNAGDYDLRVKIEYTAKSVTSARSGTIVVNVLWPG